jgi:transcriptional regulator with XRE-family HTH domain
MPETLGARLRLQRERQQISLAAIAEQTKIKASLLEELERDDASHWPSGIFRRAFVRAYAQAIGLDADSVVREFTERHPDPEEDFSDVMTAVSVGGVQAVNKRPPTRLGCLLKSAVKAVSGRKPAPKADAVTIAPFSLIAPAPEPASAQEVATVAAPAPPDPPADPPAPAAVVEAPVPVIRAVVNRNPDLSALAHLCTRLACVCDTEELPPLLEEAATILDAVGVIVWVWEPMLSALTPLLSHGYADAVLAHIPAVRRDADNAIADAFRSGETRTVSGGEDVTGAIVVPLMAPARCIGVLALELRRGAEQRESMRALATIVAAQLVTLVGPVPLAEAVNA